MCPNRDGIVQEERIGIKMEDGSIAYASLIPFYRDSEEPVSYELRLFVPQMYRKRGIGRKLLADTLLAADHDKKVLWLIPKAQDEKDHTQLTDIVLREWALKNGFVQRGAVMRRGTIDERAAALAAQIEHEEHAANELQEQQSLDIMKGDDQEEKDADVGEDNTDEARKEE